jgi:hypothetical protein
MEKVINELIKDTKSFYATITIALIVFVFILSISITLSAPLPIGSDPYFHLEIARLYGTGNFTGAFNYISSVNIIPFYPFLFHILLIPIAISPYPLDGLKIIEMLAMPLTFLFTMRLLWKHSGPKAALITGLVLLGSWSFIDGAYQARPETLDLMLYPLMLSAILAVKKKTFATYVIASIYNHGIMALMNIWGWAAKFFKERKTWLTAVAMTLAVSSPILILTAIYFGGGWAMWATTKPAENPQEVLFWTNPSWIPFYAGITIIGFVFLAINIIKYFRHQPISVLEQYLVIGIIGNTPMLYLWADRWLQYLTIPLAALTGLEVARWHGKRLYIVLAFIALGAWIYISFFLWNIALHNFWQPGSFVHK